MEFDNLIQLRLYTVGMQVHNFDCKYTQNGNDIFQQFITNQEHSIQITKMVSRILMNIN